MIKLKSDLGNFLSTKFCRFYFWTTIVSCESMDLVYSNQENYEYLGLKNLCTLMVCLHEQCFSVPDATAASKDRNNPIFCAVSDAAVASDTENHCPCK
jgi:hypothetical protein